MVALSRALVLDPPTLLLDEPSLGIAPALVDEIYERIALAANEARTLIIVEQHVHKVLAVADRAYVLRRGAVVLSGDVAELRKGNQLEEAYLS
jgi:ABC-type branched-subunit amino acid transport system ATPase component